tara:strand:- start:32072 stop:33028 length:957 start_codon:yes stop_codon:yes gene_type:complete
MKINNQFCSPSAKDNGPTCLSKESLKMLIDTYNNTKKYKKDKIIYYDNNTQLELFKKLDNKLKKKTKGSGKYWFWPNIIQKLVPINNFKSNLIITSIKKIEKFELKPELPNEWLKNPYEWLSNYDIDHIMFQYSNATKYSYKYLGTFSIDFAVKNASGQCLYSNFCDINIKKYISKKIKYIGFITNLDKHDESGSHWTSTFININYKSDSYGAYYYDSVARKTPVLINTFLNNIKQQCNKLYPKRQFVIKHNYKQHQYGNSECGIFSILYQIRWINYLYRNNNTLFKKIIESNDLNDKNANFMRKSLYRPNFKQLTKK